MESIEQLIYDETQRRLEEMKKPDYVYPEKADSKDAIIIILSIFICTVLIILCMMGVIK